MRAILAVVSVLFLTTPSHAQISKLDFGRVVKAFQKTFLAPLEAKTELLLINPIIPGHGDPWDFDYMHAAYSSVIDAKTSWKIHYIFFMGGYAKMPGMTMDGAALVLCHEVGHGLGQGPFKLHVEPAMNIEPEADYFATSQCLRNIYAVLPAVKIPAPLSPYVEKVCREKYQTVNDLEWCYRGFEAIQTEIIFFELNPWIKTKTSLEAHDSKVAKSIDLRPDYYPSPQCRIDTLVAGVLGNVRPRCWWAP